MIKSRIAAAAALLAATTGTAVGGNVSATVGLVSDYDFRGISQTLNDPAFQAGLTYTSDTGLYYGLWGSNVDFQGSSPGATYKNSDIDRPSTEMDVFLGFSGEKVVGYDLGVIYYSYPNSGELNYAEAYASVSKGPGTLKVWWAWNDFGGKGRKGAVYTEANLNVPMNEGFSFLAHFGYSDTSKTMALGNYLDWSLGVGYSASNFDLSLKWVDGSDLSTPVGAPKNLGRFVFGVTTTLPWDKE
jgi:uncharacterized protein (TIGR02001 family)